VLASVLTDHVPCRLDTVSGNAFSRRRTQQPGTYAPFVDPNLTALDAPVLWLPEIGAATLNGTAIRAGQNLTADLTLSGLTCLRHIVIECDNVHQLLVHATDAAITIDLRGDRIVDTPVNVVFHVEGLAQARKLGALLMHLPRVLNGPPRHVVTSVRRNLLRNALIALDGRRVGASYRDMAAVAFGDARAKAAWNSPSRAMKDQMIRAHDKGVELASGGYRRFFR
jgi:Uncharacterized conserved protein (DUF2285)